jgi:hypothetical protein
MFDVYFRRVSSNSFSVLMVIQSVDRLYAHNASIGGAIMTFAVSGLLCRKGQWHVSAAQARLRPAPVPAPCMQSRMTQYGSFFRKLAHPGPFGVANPSPCTDPNATMGKQPQTETHIPHITYSICIIAAWSAKRCNQWLLAEAKADSVSCYSTCGLWKLNVRSRLN